uniref:Retinol binding protein 1, cellular, tandem duplicate 1 n=1 Tax=Oncorhynchus kisutch TaxID=8019 RepID=A0A8C7LUG9_ONCKI
MWEDLTAECLLRHDCNNVNVAIRKIATLLKPTKTSVTMVTTLSSRPSVPLRTTTWISMLARSLRRICQGSMTENAWSLEHVELCANSSSRTLKPALEQQNGTPYLRVQRDTDTTPNLRVKRDMDTTEVCDREPPIAHIRLSIHPFIHPSLFHSIKTVALPHQSQTIHNKDVNVAIRKIANLLKTDKDISVDGDHMVIKTLSTFKNYNMDFHVGKEFEEDLSGVDDRKCMTTISWEGDKLVCVQKGEKEGRGWTHWVEGDKLYLELRVCGVVCKQSFQKT